MMVEIGEIICAAAGVIPSEDDLCFKMLLPTIYGNFFYGELANKPLQLTATYRQTWPKCADGESSLITQTRL